MENEEIIVDESTPEGQPATGTPGTTETEPTTNPELKAYADRLKAENEQYRASAIEVGLRQIGLDPGVGLGIAVAESFKGVVTPEALAQHAAEKYKYDPDADENPATADVTSAQKADALHQQSQSVTPQPDPTPVEQSEQRMADPEATRKDARESITNKMNQFSEQFYPN